MVPGDRGRMAAHLPERAAVDVMSDQLALFHDENRLPFVKYVRSRRLGAPDAEDIVNDTFLILHRKRNEFARCDNPQAFAFKILIGCVVDYTRRLDRRPLPVETSRGQDREWVEDDPSEAVVVRIDLERAIDTLPDRQAEGLWLHYYSGRTTAEIARYLEISESTVTNHLSAGRRSLETSLVGYGTRKEVKAR